MSQEGIVDVLGTFPQIPTSFVANIGTAVPIANTLEVLGTTQAAGTTPLHTTGSGNTLTIIAQLAQANAVSSTSIAGLASFNSADFSVDANGYVTLAGGGGAVETFAVQSGTSPVSPTGAGLITFNGATVAAGTHPVRTDGTGPNTMALEVQFSQAVVSTNATNVGLAAFNSAQFSVDANGFVSTSGTGVLATLTGNSGGAISPVAGNINTVGTGSLTVVGSGNTLTAQLTGLTNHAVLVGAGTATITNIGPTATVGQVLQSAGAAADPAFSTATYPLTTTINQILYSSSANTVTGLATANSAVLTTTAAGVPVLTALAVNGQLIIGSTAGAPAAATLTAGTGVTITNASNSITIAVSGSVVGQTITGDTGGALSPTAGNWNIKANSTGGASVSFSGSGSTLSLNTSDASGNTTIGLSAGNTASATNFFNTAVGNLALASGNGAIENSIFGYDSASLLLTGSGNSIFGYASGTNLHSSESFNILINHPGVLGESNAIHIGNSPNQTKCSIAGIAGVSVSNLNIVTINTSTGQLGSQAAANVGTVTQYDVLVGGAAGAIASVGPGSTGQVLQSGGAAANPAYSTATYPATATGTGTILRADGTNWVATTATYPTTTTSQQILYSTANNVVGELTTANSKFPATNSSGTLAMRAFSVVTQVFAASGTYTPTAGMVYCQVICIGGGGAGGGAAATGAGQYSVGSGGGYGEYAVGNFSASTIGASQTVTVAANATGNSGAAGSNGGTCSLGALITAFGGTGGGTATASTAVFSGGGAGGTGGSGGSYRTPGTAGFFALGSVTAVLLFGGQGASGQIGSGGLSAVETGANGSNASGYGAGGGGAANTASLTAKTGGNATQGVVIVNEYIIA